MIVILFESVYLSVEHHWNMQRIMKSIDNYKYMHLLYVHSLVDIRWSLNVNL